MVHGSSGSRSDCLRTGRIPIPPSLPMQASISSRCLAEEPCQARASRRDLKAAHFFQRQCCCLGRRLDDRGPEMRRMWGNCERMRVSIGIDRSPSNHSRRCSNNRLRVSASRELSCNREAIANREHAQLDARVVADPGIEDPKRLGVLGTVALVGDSPAPEYVVEQRQTARAQ